MIRLLAVRWHQARQAFAQAVRRYGKTLEDHASARVSAWLDKGRWR